MSQPNDRLQNRELSLEQEVKGHVKRRGETVIFALREAESARRQGTYLPDQPPAEKVRMFEPSILKSSAYVPQPELIKHTVRPDQAHYDNTFEAIIAADARLEHPTQEQVDDASQAAFDDKTKTILDEEVMPAMEQMLREVERSARPSHEILEDLRNR